MMDFKFKALVFVALLVSAFFLVGCTLPTKICGDTICSVGEENTCPTDCPAKINGSVIVNISGAYDSTQEMWLEYYSNSNVNYTANTAIESVLGENWSGLETKNLSIALNQASVVKKPIPSNREIVISNLSTGEYYFTVRSNDYAYFGTSEKITISEDRNYYVSLVLKPSQPVLRLKAFDGNTGTILTGVGRISVYEVLENYVNGENQINESLVSSVDFTSGQEMNALFYLWSTQQAVDYRTHFKAIVEKEGYNSVVWDYLYTDQKYNESTVTLFRTEQKTGSFGITIVPGYGTTEHDLAVLEGTRVSVMNSNDFESRTTEVIQRSSGGKLHLILEDYPYGSYYAVPIIEYDLNSVPVSFYWNFEINSSIPMASMEAVLGSIREYSVKNSLGNLLDPQKVLINSVCSYYQDTNSCTSYAGYESHYWSDILSTNPRAYIIPIQNSEEARKMTSTMIVISLTYNGVTKEFSAPYLVQGRDIMEMVLPTISTTTPNNGTNGSSVDTNTVPDTNLTAADSNSKFAD